METLKIIIIGLLIVSCTPKNDTKKIVTSKKEVQLETSKIVTDTLFNAMGAYFYSDKNNNIFLNWSEEIDTSKTNVLKYKMFDKKNNQFGRTITVGTSKGMQAHHESMAKIAKTKDGTTYAIFRILTPNTKNRFAGSIFYSISVDDGKNWSPKRKLVNTEASLSQSFYDVALLPDGELGLCWLDSRKQEKDKDGSTLYFAKTKGDSGFYDEKPIAGSTCQCCRTDLFVDESNEIHIAFRNITEGSIRDMYRVGSIDNGLTFTSPVVMGNDNWKIDGCPHTGPSFANNSKDLAVAWFTGATSGIGIFFKKLSNDVSPYDEKTLISTIGRHPQMIGLPNGNFYIVYEEFYKVDDQSYSHIMLHTMNSDGTELKKKISKPRTINDHAIISKIDNDKLLVAWANKDHKKSKIEYIVIDCSTDLVNSEI